MVVGIDLGLTGAICQLSDDGNVISLTDTPVSVSDKTKRSSYDVKAIAAIFSYLPSGTIVVAEKVHAQPQNGSVASFSMGKALGMVEALAAAYGLTLMLVEPSKWKASYNLLKTQKVDSITTALTLQPSLTPQLTKTIKGVRVPLLKSHNRAEAYLIAAYGRNQTAG